MGPTTRNVAHQVCTPTTREVCKNVPVEKCETVQRRVCKNTFGEADRSSRAQTEKDVSSSGGLYKKCKSATTCKKEKKVECKTEPMQECKNIKRKLCHKAKDLSKANKRKLKNRMCKNVCDYTYSCKNC